MDSRLDGPSWRCFQVLPLLQDAPVHLHAPCWCRYSPIRHMLHGTLTRNQCEHLHILVSDSSTSCSSSACPSRAFSTRVRPVRQLGSFFRSSTDSSTAYNQFLLLHADSMSDQAHDSLCCLSLTCDAAAHLNTGKARILVGFRTPVMTCIDLGLVVLLQECYTQLMSSSTHVDQCSHEVDGIIMHA